MATYTGNYGMVAAQIRIYVNRDFKPNKLISSVKDGIRLSLNEMKTDYEKTVTTWKRPPHFYVRPRKLQIEHRSKRYNWLDFGARRYVRVRRDFIAKTERGWIGSRPGHGDIIRKKTGGAKFFRPYNAAGRGWTQAIVERQIREGRIQRNIRGSLMGNINAIFPPRNLARMR